MVCTMSDDIDPTRRSPSISKEQEFGETGPAFDFEPPTLSDHRSFGVGDLVENCRLVALLGTGASGEAYLAQEIGLADRPIVIKFAPAEHDEHLALAQLQHTHIMPLLWARAIPPFGLRVLAMPYLARTTLTDLLHILGNSPIAEWSGQRVFEVMREDQNGLPIQLIAEDHPAQVLKELTWVDFVLRMGITLAEALAYAHHRKVLHLDVKPSNIVLTPDGQPILLDLDVARPPIAAGDTVVPWLGGTTAYMSPEQKAAMDALLAHEPIPDAIDERSDLYSLGIVLYQALGGNLESETKPDPHQLAKTNPNINQELAEILAHCLAENPAERYADCSALATDLDRHLNDLPLIGVPNHVSARWRKWRRRRPFGLALVGLLAAFCVVSSLAGLLMFRSNAERRMLAETALADGLELQRKGQHSAAVQRFLAGRAIAESCIGGQSLTGQLSRRLHVVQRFQIADELDKLVHLMRFQALQQHTSRRMQHVLEAAGRKVWAERELLMDRQHGRLEATIEDKIDSQLQDFVVLWSDLQLKLAPAAYKETVRVEVFSTLDQAEQLFGSSLACQLARLNGANRLVEEAQFAPAAAWEYCAIGRLALQRGDVESAVRNFQHAVKREPLAPVAILHLAVGNLREKKYVQAIEGLSYCLGNEPSAECLLLRSEAFAGLGNLEQALQDVNLAIEKNPTLAFAYRHRGSIHTRLGRLEDAAKDEALSRKYQD